MHLGGKKRQYCRAVFEANAFFEGDHEKQVLIPVDTARNSLTAEEYAIKLNWRMLAVTLLNVLNTKRLEQHGISPDDQQRIKDSMRKRAEKVLAAAAEPFHTAGWSTKR